MNKAVAKKTDLFFTPAFPGLKGVDIMASAFPIEPFLVFTEFYMDKAVFGPHPHAGISVLTYMLPDSKEGFINRDSKGDFSFIEPGGAHIMQAGSGMLHDEFPRITGLETHGFQIWINHSAKDRMAKPLSMHASANEISEINSEEFKIRIVHGTYGGKSSPYQMLTDVNLLHIYLKANCSLAINAKETAFAYGLNGSGTTNGEAIMPQTMVNYSTQGETVTIQALENGLEFMLGTGTPHQEPLVYGGPFVMTTHEQILAAQQHYSSGEMGSLAPYKG